MAVRRERIPLGSYRARNVSEESSTAVMAKITIFPEKTMTEEEWRIIPNRNYEVSSFGRVRRLSDSYWGMKRTHIRAPAGYILKQRISSSGYPNVLLAVGNPKDRKFENRLVSQLVCEAFHGSRPAPHYDAAHNDGNILNSDKDNLRWATKKENCADQLIHGTRLRGERSPASKLTRENVIEMRRLAKSGYSFSMLATKYNISRSGVKNVLHRITWAWLEQPER